MLLAFDSTTLEYDVAKPAAVDAGLGRSFLNWAPSQLADPVHAHNAHNAHNAHAHACNTEQSNEGA